MKKIFTLAAAAIISSAAFSVNAEVLPGMTVLEPTGDYVSSVSTIRLAWDYDTETGKGATLKIAVPTRPVTLTYNGTTYTFRQSQQHTPSVDANNNVLVITLADVASGVQFGEGDYVLSLPANYVSYGSGSVNTAAEVKFSVVGSLSGSPEVTPQGGPITVPELDGQTITLNYGDEYTSLKANTEAGDITVTFTNNGAAPVTEILNDYSFDNTTLSIKMMTGIQDNSTVTVTVPQNFVIAEDADGKIYVGGGTSITYNVWNGLPEATILQKNALDTNTIIPTKAAYGDYLPLQLTGDNLPLELFFWDRENGKGGDTPDVTMTVYPDCRFENGPQGQPNGILVVDVNNVVNQVFDAGYDPVCWYFNLPEGVIESEGRINPYLRNFIIFQLPKVINLTPATVYNPTDQTLTLYFDHGGGFSDKNGNVTEPAVLESPTGERIPVTFQAELSATLGHVEVLYLEEYGVVDDVTSYRLYVPFGYFKLALSEGNVLNQGVNPAWYLLIQTASGSDNETSGIDEIGTSDSPAIYYDLTGRRILNPEKGKVTIVVKNGKASKVIF